MSIAYLLFGLLSGAVFFLAPGSDARLTELIDWQRRLMPLAGISSNPPVWSFYPALNIIRSSIIFGVVFTLVPLYFLVARRAAFHAQSR